MALVIQYTDTRGFGGAERALLNLLAGLDRGRWEPVLALTPSRGVEPLIREARALEVPIMALPPIDRRSALRRVPALARRLRVERPAVFHAHLTWPPACQYGLLAAALARVPAVVATEQLFMPVTERRAIALQRFAARGVDRYLPVSHEVARRLVTEIGLPGSRMRVVHNGIRPEAFGRPVDPALRSELAGGSGRPIVLTAARLDPQKGLDVLLEAAARVPDALFVVAGDGPLRPDLEAEAARLGLSERVRFLGQRDDLPGLLAACDLFVLPSRYEGLPLSVVEAMFAQRPVVATAIGGTNEAVVDGETGLLVPVGDGALLAAAIRRLLDDRSLAGRMAEAGRRRANARFTADAMVAAVGATYQEILGAKGIGPTARRGRRHADDGQRPLTLSAREAERNRLLRRVDWRLLLPRTRFRRSVCLADGVLARALGAVSDAVADARATPHAVCDLAAALDPDPAALRRVSAWLAPEGWAYLEWRLPAPGGIPRRMRRVREAGLDPVATYWSWPPPGRGLPRFWLPLDDATGIRRLTGRPDRAGSLSGRIRRGLGGVALRAGVRAGLIAPLIVLATTPRVGWAEPSERPGGHPDVALPTGLTRGVLAAWPTHGLLGGPTGAPVLLTGGERSISKVIALLPGPESAGDRPVVVKLARVPEAVNGLRREAAVLRWLEAARGATVDGVPRVLFCREADVEGIAVAETALVGRRVDTRLGRRTARSIALAGTDWLVGLAGVPRPGELGSWADRIAGPILAAFEEQFGSVVDGRRLQIAADLIRSIGDLPLVPEQRDFAPWNLLVDGAGRIGVLDWESAETDGIPGPDLVYFLTHLAFYVEGAMRSGRFLETYRRSIDGRTIVGALAAECWERYRRAVGIPADALPALRLLTWAIHARSDHRALAADAGAKPASVALAGSRFLALWNEELDAQEGRS